MLSFSSTWSWYWNSSNVSTNIDFFFNDLQYIDELIQSQVCDVYKRHYSFKGIWFPPELQEALELCVKDQTERETDLLFLVLVHFPQRQEVFDEKHDVDSTQSRQALPHRVQVLLLLIMEVMSLREIHPRVLVVVMVASLRLKRPQT